MIVMACGVIPVRCSAWDSTSAAASLIVLATATHPQEQDTAHDTAMTTYTRVRGTRRRRATRRRSRQPVIRATARRAALAIRPISSAIVARGICARLPYVAEARAWRSQVQSHESGAADGGAMFGLLKRSTTPSRSIRQTIVSTARGRH